MASASPAPPSINRQGQDYARQQQLIMSLLKIDRYPHQVRSVRLVETHISWLLLAGRYAYKIKKAVDFGFLDFTELSARRFYCDEEIRLNLRLAPQLYLDTIPIGGTSAEPLIGDSPGNNPIIEYAVRMRRFAISKLMDGMLGRGLVTISHMDSLARIMASFHTRLPPSVDDSGYGTAESIRLPERQNFDQIAALFDKASQEAVARIRKLSEREFNRCEPLFELRRTQGRIRECHGDLHLGNIVLLRGIPTPFDGIEFNPALRWIDVMSEMAFLVMDLLCHDRSDLAYRLLNTYLEHTGDYQGIGVLRFYTAYRAVVRTKICAFSLNKNDISLIAGESQPCRHYLAFAENHLAWRRPVLLITHGLPGCGKTAISQIALERFSAIRVRSDVERKRLFGLEALQKSSPHLNLYTPEATLRTYDRLFGAARVALEAGYPVIVDAAFLRHAERAQFQALANELKLPFIILDIQAQLTTLRARVQQRRHGANDASEADLAVLEKLQDCREPLQPDELRCAVKFVNEGALGELAPAFEELQRKLIPGNSEQGHATKYRFMP